MYLLSLECRVSISSGMGLIYDERMKAHRCESYAHPECPERISRIWEKLVEEGVVSRCERVPARDVTEEELLLVHTYVRGRGGARREERRDGIGVEVRHNSYP